MVYSTINPRKRGRSVAGMMSMALVALGLDTTSAFTTNPSLSGRGARAHSIISLPTALRSATSHSMVASSILRDDVPESTLAMAPPRLSPDDQKELLLQAVELRRIQNVEEELAMRIKNATPFLSIRSKEAGYGDDLVAFQEAISSGERARQQLIATNMGLVHYCVSEIVGTRKLGNNRRLNSLSREDLVQEGAIGLARAIDRWNPAIGGKFSTYAVYWVRAAVLRCIAEKDDMLRVPEHVSAAVRKMTRGAKKLGLDLDGENLLSTVYASDASWKEAKAAKALAEEAGLTNKQLTEAMRIRQRRNAGGYVTFEAWMQKGKDIETDVSTLSSREAPLRSVEVEDLKKALGKYLRPKEMEALFWRYGLLDESQKSAEPQQPKNYLARAEEELYGKTATTSPASKSIRKKAEVLPVGGKWGEAMSFTEVGNRMEVSAEYGRRLCHAALKKLRQAANDGLLEPALLF
jgi:RNA polymerase sigma factor (sigma-70 family)